MVFLCEYIYQFPNKLEARNLQATFGSEKTEKKNTFSFHLKKHRYINQTPKFFDESGPERFKCMNLMYLESIFNLLLTE